MQCESAIRRGPGTHRGKIVTSELTTTSVTSSLRGHRRSRPRTLTPIHINCPTPKSDCPPHVPAVERWEHPGEARFVGDEVPADDDLAEWVRHHAV